MAAQVSAVESRTRPGETSASPPAEEKKWTRYTIMGRHMLVAECQVPTTYVQGAQGTVRKGENKGKAAANREKTIRVAKASVMAVLEKIAIWDKNGDSKTNWPSNGRLASWTGLSIGTVNSAVRVLTQAHWLWKTPRGNITNSKLCHLRWDLIEASHEKYVPKKKGIVIDQAGPAQVSVKPMATSPPGNGKLMPKEQIEEAKDEQPETPEEDEEDDEPDPDDEDDDEDEDEDDDEDEEEEEDNNEYLDERAERAEEDRIRKRDNEQE